MSKRPTAKWLTGRRAGRLALGAVTAVAGLAVAVGGWSPSAQASSKHGSKHASSSRGAGSSGSTSHALQETFVRVIKEASPSVVLV
ncbi:MAG: hypothetical protein ACRDXC_13490, partial [Acidimicrobiales bacterium]